MPQATLPQITTIALDRLLPPLSCFIRLSHNMLQGYFGVYGPGLTSMSEARHSRSDDRYSNSRTRGAKYSVDLDKKAQTQNCLFEEG